MTHAITATRAWLDALSLPDFVLWAIVIGMAALCLAAAADVRRVYREHRRNSLHNAAGGEGEGDRVGGLVGLHNADNV